MKMKQSLNENWRENEEFINFTFLKYLTNDTSMISKSLKYEKGRKVWYNFCMRNARKSERGRE